MEDFVHEDAEEGFYQIHIARLTLFLRQILHCRFGPGDQTITPGQIHTEIERWHSDLQQSLQRWPHNNVPFTCSVALELRYNYYLLLLYIQKPTFMQQGAPLHHYSEQPPDGIVESCARTIASYAITLATKTNVYDLPHELFPAFFVAGIVLYRQMQDQNELLSQMAQANLDNCRIILNQAKEEYISNNSWKSGSSNSWTYDNTDIDLRIFRILPWVRYLIELKW